MRVGGRSSVPCAWPSATRDSDGTRIGTVTATLPHLVPTRTLPCLLVSLAARTPIEARAPLRTPSPLVVRAGPLPSVQGQVTHEHTDPEDHSSTSSWSRIS